MFAERESVLRTRSSTLAVIAVCDLFLNLTLQLIPTTGGIDVSTEIVVPSCILCSVFFNYDGGKAVIRRSHVQADDRGRNAPSASTLESDSPGP